MHVIVGIDEPVAESLVYGARGQQAAASPVAHLHGAREEGDAAESAEVGLRVFTEEEPDAVIVDLMMEEVDAGVRFARELQIRRSEVPIFMLSSVGDNFNLTTDYSTLGLAGIFQKPMTKDTLLNVLRETLAATPSA